MKRITIKDKTFETSMPEAEIKNRVKELAQQMSRDLEGKNPLLLAVLNGAFIFAADLMREMTIPCEISFVKLASYQGTISTGKVKEVIGINEDLTGRTIIIVEDIVDTGRSMSRLVRQLRTLPIAGFSLCALIDKHERRECTVVLDYSCFQINAGFLVGYGLDYAEKFRHLPGIYELTR